MDFKVSRKETRYQPDGSGVMVLTDNVFDLYPVYGNPINTQMITDVEMLDNPREELIDRAMFALIKQRGADPVSPSDGNRWAEALIGEVSGVTVIDDIYKSVSVEGAGVRVSTDSIAKNGKAGTAFKIEIVEGI